MVMFILVHWGCIYLQKRSKETLWPDHPAAIQLLLLNTNVCGTNADIHFLLYAYILNPPEKARPNLFLKEERSLNP